MIYVDAPVWEAHGTTFAHVISDESYDELHTFARRVGLDRRSWDGDHYDVPLRRYEDVLTAGAQVVDTRTIARLLERSGLRFRKRRGERPLTVSFGVVPGLDAPHRLDVVASTIPTPAATTVAAATFVRDARGCLLLVRTERRGTWEAPAGGREPGELPRTTAVREVAEESGLAVPEAVLRPVGYERVLLDAATGRWPGTVNHIQVFAADLDDVAPRLQPCAGETSAAEWVERGEVPGRCKGAMWWPLLARHLEQRAGLGRPEPGRGR